EHEGASLEEVARAAGFTPENNRTPESAFAFLYNMAEENPRVRAPVVTLGTLAVLPGNVSVPAPLDTGSWTIGDLLVARLPDATALVEGLPWAVVNGIRTSELHAPPHEPTEV